MNTLEHAITRALPGLVVTDADVIETYRYDQAQGVPAGTPRAVVLPRSADDVATAVEIASTFDVPIVTRGAGSGLSGGANAIDGGLVIGLHRMDRILDVDVANLTATVQPGVVNAVLSEHVGSLGMLYPPDPASAGFSTIGGNIATNAGGLCCIKYGVTGDYVLEVEVVLADGERMRAGRRTRKGVAGYDLTALFVGSEGTLGIVTEATVRLIPASAQPSTVVAFFDTLDAAITAVEGISASAVTPSLLELMDGTTVQAVESRHHMGLDLSCRALLIAQSDAPAGVAEADAQKMAAAMTTAGASYVTRSTNASESRDLITARQLAYPALEALGTTLLDDVAVPRTRVGELIRRIEAVAEEEEVMIGTFGHVGDGNVHPTIVFDRSRDDQRVRAERAFSRLLDITLELGGTLTGEHGVGLLKRPFLEGEIGSRSLALQRRLRRAFDPRGLLNPDKVL